MLSTREAGLVALALALATVLAVVPSGATAATADDGRCVSYDVADQPPEPVQPAAYPSWYTGGPLTDCEDRIQPGSLVNVGGGFCTLNFVFQDSQGTVYVGSAGHCMEAGDTAEALGVGTFGTAVFASGSPDFGLIEVDDDKRHLVQPRMCEQVWGHEGPTGLWSEGSIGSRLYLFGFGIATDVTDETRDRTGPFVRTDGWRVSHAVPSAPGDSGAPILNDAGEAVGIHYATALGSLFGLEGPKLATDIHAAIDVAHDAGYDIELVTVGEDVAS